VRLYILWYGNVKVLKKHLSSTLNITDADLSETSILQGIISHKRATADKNGLEKNLYRCLHKHTIKIKKRIHGIEFDIKS
jgi:hypothetical protein